MATNEEIKAKLNMETGKLVWQELERYFAKGIVIHVDKEFDLLDIAAAIVEDQKDQVEKLLDLKKISKPDLEKAEKWHAQKQVFWTVVVAPWILIQELKP